MTASLPSGTSSGRGRIVEREMQAAQLDDDVGAKTVIGGSCASQDAVSTRTAPRRWIGETKRVIGFKFPRMSDQNWCDPGLEVRPTRPNGKRRMFDATLVLLWLNYNPTEVDSSSSKLDYILPEQLALYGKRPTVEFHLNQPTTSQKMHFILPLSTNHVSIAFMWPVMSSQMRYPHHIDPPHYNAAQESSPPLYLEVPYMHMHRDAEAPQGVPVQAHTFAPEFQENHDGLFGYGAQFPERDPPEVFPGIWPHRALLVSTPPVNGLRNLVGCYLNNRDMRVNVNMVRIEPSPGGHFEVWIALELADIF
ncbi:hypothetical protein BJY52DRAFT_1414948 [Lactarius psammicola]|nr:hypothetical protein BJY52DRAFT_1414948 [Lactarius psammicola]